MFRNGYQNARPGRIKAALALRVPVALRSPNVGELGDGQHLFVRHLLHDTRGFVKDGAGSSFLRQVSPVLEEVLGDEGVPMVAPKDALLVGQQHLELRGGAGGLAGLAPA